MIAAERRPPDDCRVRTFPDRTDVTNRPRGGRARRSA